MESSTPPASSPNDDSNAQDPLALPNTAENISSLYSATDMNRDQNGLMGNDKENHLNDNPANHSMYPSDPVIMKHDEHPLSNEQRLQYDGNHQMQSNYDQQKINQMNMQHANLHEPHKTFSHSIENLSKTTEKCPPNDMKIFPNLIDGHDQYDDGYETGVGDLLSHKYKLPSLPPPSSSPYSHSSGMLNSMHPHHQHMSPVGMSGNYSASSSPMPPQMQQTTTGNASMMQFNDHMSSHHQHHMHGHHMSQMNNLNHQQQMQSQQQQQHMNPHGSMNGNLHSPNVGHSINPMMMNETPKKRGRKKKLRDENGNPIEDRPVKERKKHDRFNGMPEEEVTKRTLPDHLTSNLDIIIVGINPGLFAAFKGHHYAGPGNHFWKCLYLSGLTSVQMTAEEDYKLLQYGIGFTNMVQRPTKGSADLTRKEIKEGSRILLEKIRKFQPKIAVFNGKLIFEVFSGKKDFCFGKQPETVEGTNTYMWVMPSSSARCAQLPRAADKVPFYAALKKFRDYLNGLVPEYDESDYVFNDPKYSQISTEAELKEEAVAAAAAIAFTSLEGSDVVLADPNKKKRGRPKKVRGENGEEISAAPKQRKNNHDASNTDGNDDDSSKKKRGRPKKTKDGTTTPSTPAQPKKRNSKQSAARKEQMSENNSPQQLTPPSSVPSQVSGDMSAMQHHQIQQHVGLMNSNNVNRSFLPPMESPSAASNAYNNNGAINQNHMQQHNRQQSQNASPVNLCFPQTSANIDQVVAQPEISPHHQQTYQQRQTPVAQQQQMYGVNGTSPDVSVNMNAEQMTSPLSASPALVPTEFEPPQSVVNGRTSNELHPYSQLHSTNSLEQQQHLSEQEAGLGSLAHTVTAHNDQPSNETYTNNIFSGYSSSGTPNLVSTSPSVPSSSTSLLPSLAPPHHHSHYTYTSHAAAAAASQSPYTANPFSVSSLTSSSYPSAAAAAMNSYHQNLMSGSHLASPFMESPHMPVPVSPLYHSYQQQGYPGYGPPHPSALHMSNYPYYTNTGYSQTPGTSYHHSMFDRINF
ncbi:CLUMA_CG018165, isoform A [Clunio marinus]|uniref:G/T mismatch-specific thymine DNA glycosylase n=1 Tax=Clunio marinus TaxID=568069 RepID=A0A1J1J090_9DIPT|nr:CLUMA_CG018165, isoform A [Clunio marinus]